ncbi:uncharacterized protein LOC134251084 [Saccostrea cucullata]|uniref:uncharacterized protein LOC134251084 n=1 Tax=Saccostrea cuccullata TaxID=36930 RepID=UPI002ED663E9
MYVRVLGHGCRERCNFSQSQTCGRERGCIVPNSSYSGTAQDNGMKPFTSNYLQIIILIPCGLLIFIVLGAVYYLRRKLNRKEQRESNANLGNTANTCLDQEGGGDIYSHVRESKMIENTDVSQSEKYKPLEEGRSTMTHMCKSSTRQYGEEWQESASYSSPLDHAYNGEHGSGRDQTYYKGHFRESDTYNRLQLKNMFTCTLPAKTCMNMNYYALMKSNNSMSMKNINSKKESYRKEGEYMDQTYKENAPMTRSGVNRSRFFRPYSSVKYNRQVEREDNAMK